jgi:hypothetical protein
MPSDPTAPPGPDGTSDQPAASLVGMTSGPPAASMAQPMPPASTPPPSQLVEGNSAANDVNTTRVILVEWRIKKGREREFLEYWSTFLKVPDRSGLVAEFLSRLESREQHTWITWQFDDSWTTFITTGLWREAADFQRNFRAFIDDKAPLLDFEAQRRRRVLLAPERWRIGGSTLPTADHPACAEPTHDLPLAWAELAPAPAGGPESRPDADPHGAPFRR